MHAWERSSFPENGIFFRESSDKSFSILSNSDDFYRMQYLMFLDLFLSKSIILPLAFFRKFYFQIFKILNFI
jgi:hypothetical protein